MRSIGPAVGGIIFAVAGAAFAFAVNAVSYFALIRALALLTPEQAPNTLPRAYFGSAMSAGLRYIALSPNLLKVLFRSFIFGITEIVSDACWDRLWEEGLI